MAGAYKTGKYRNIFKEYGYPEEEIQKRVEDTFNTIFYGNDDERFYHEAGDDMGYMEDTGNHDVRTEGMSYGMMVCVQLDKKAEFDRLWKWVRTYMYIEDGPAKNYFAWSCQTNGKRNADGPAPDGEEYFAMALFFASKRWGDGDGIFCYSKEAQNILRECVHKGEPGHSGEPMWEPSNKLIKFVTNMDFSDPSYHLPHFYELFAQRAYEEDRDFWKEAAAASRAYLHSACHEKTGLSAEYADYPVVGPDQVDYVDVSPQQIASVSAGLIPFLEHDDGHRALMGCNMMRQAVPLLHNDAPIVGTGLEKQVCEDSRTMVTAEGEGVIEYVDATTIRILYDRTEDDEFVSFEPALKEYRIPKFRRTNQNMTIDLRPICNKGQRVKKGDILTEGYATENGELALGRNLLVAYIPWKGYNYEDAVVISERMVRDDVLTSVHVDEYSLDVRETKRGVEEFTSDIPNVSEEATKDLDDNGIVRVGARIEPGDIMIGKISPKGESDPSPEEKLLRAIFGDKAGDVKDSSLKANPSLSGVVIDKKLFSRAIKTRESKKQDKIILAKIDEEYEAKGDDLKDILVDKLLTLTEGMTSEGVKDYTGAEIITKGSTFTATALKNLEYDGVQSNKWTKDEHTNGLIQRLIMNYIRKYKQLDAELKRRKFAITIGDELPSGILQMAKVYIAKKRKIQVGDKLAGRHGNKGIVSKVVRLEDMPFMADGRPVDMVLNPLGVPSRMNLGQIFECILGAAGKKLGVKFATPIFDGAKLDDLSEWTDKAGLPRFCSTYLYDGETGEQFDQPATVGMTYFLKLGHMVEDKMHARSIGPYSLITQQPLGGKAQFGGQRFGEMEVWAIEAFGASHVLQEILTVKSDDVVGRSKAYEAIVKGDPMPTPGIPESLNVLLHELRGLGLSIKLD